MADLTSSVAVFLLAAELCSTAGLASPTDSFAARRLVLVDLNGDGYPDLAVANGDLNGVAVLFGRGNGTFGDPAYFGTSRWPGAIVAGDFNKDRLPDLATANHTAASGVTILINQTWSR
jgi:hypothetical protein